VCKQQYEKKEEQARQREIMAGYPEEIKAYLEEKYGREFCVFSTWESEDNGPVPFAPPSYGPYTFLAWENEEDGYAFWTSVYPKSLDDKRIKEIRDNYYNAFQLSAHFKRVSTFISSPASISSRFHVQ